MGLHHAACEYWGVRRAPGTTAIDAKATKPFPGSAAARLQFGLFEFEPSTHELRREGIPVRLQPQPAQVLALLLAHPGDLVTRESLREALWGAETFVDFDRGLNFCIAQIRAALGDAADSPRFVRTVPKRGYQFIAPVARGPEARSRRRNRRWVIAALIAVPSFALGLGALGLWLIAPPRVTRVAVTRFDNETGNPDLDRFADALTDSVVADLTTAAAGRYGVIGNAAILRHPRPQRDLLAIGTSLQARYVVLGQVQMEDGHIRVLAHLIRLPEQVHVGVDLFHHVDDPQRSASDLAAHIVSDFSSRIGPSS